MAVGSSAVATCRCLQFCNPVALVEIHPKPCNGATLTRLSLCALRECRSIAIVAADRRVSLCRQDRDPSNQAARRSVLDTIRHHVIGMFFGFGAKNLYIRLPPKSSHTDHSQLVFISILTVTGRDTKICMSTFFFQLGYKFYLSIHCQHGLYPDHEILLNRSNR